MEKLEPCLYIVATPIGNLNELTPRALYVLENADIIACEDTRQTFKLLSHFKINKPLVSCHEHNEKSATKGLLNKIKEGNIVAYVSDAGYPGISDPGSIIISQAINDQITVRVISGPCAIINALVASGLPTDHFYFHGFLNSKNSKKNQELKDLALKKETLILYESKHRLLDTLNDLLVIFGNRQICVCRELTKLHEEYKRSSISEAINYFSDPKGEFVLVIQGNQEQDATTIDYDKLIVEVNELITQGLSKKDAIKQIAEKYQLAKNDLYNIYHQ